MSVPADRLGSLAHDAGGHIPEEPAIESDLIRDEQVTAFFTDLHVERLARAKKIASYDFPVWDKEEVSDVYARVSEAERRLAAPELLPPDYDIGTAGKDDHLAVFPGSKPILITAEHATAHYRRDGAGVLTRKGPDIGTAGLGYVLHQDLGAFFITMRGLQTGDANYQVRHPLKNVIRQLIVQHEIKTFVSLHGMKAGKFSQFADERAYDVLLGVGAAPNRASGHLARRLDETAASLDLRCAINEWFVEVVEDEPLVTKVDEQGRVTFNGFHAPEYTTRSFAQAVGERHGRPVAAVQVELSDLLRRVTENLRRGRKTRQVGTYAGYALLMSSLATEASG
jgi:hypothetical protein